MYGYRKNGTGMRKFETGRNHSICVMSWECGSHGHDRWFTVCVARLRLMELVFRVWEMSKRRVDVLDQGLM